MNRRKFLTITGIGAAAMAIPTIGLTSTSLFDAAKGVLHQEFNYLNLDGDGVDQYLHEYLKKNSEGISYELKMKAFHLFNVRAEKSTIVTHLTQNYLLSTDFFINKMDETKTVYYLGPYNPYTAPCTNPYTNHFYPSAS
ncbi:hypothetical protein [Anditalea andensis]|uniref:Uncharacterized protein n=1 Tax=Anditalea andensis TaxID=1048983 RepID=A0A074KY58_9BACT|nr:hypothetical protein [Anditalea andensis]KEO73110.1 hypothetical protein EL17_15995 [Anditalea andensis]